MSRELVLCMSMMSQTVGAADFGLSKDHLANLQTTEQTKNKTNATNMAVQSQCLSNGTGAQQQQKQKKLSQMNILAKFITLLFFVQLHSLSI